MSQQQHPVFYLLLLSVFSVGWKWKDLSLKFQPKSPFQLRTEWVVDTREGHFPRVQSARYSPPLLDGELIFQPGPAGVKAYQKGSGRLTWKHEGEGEGFAGPLLLQGKSLYFGSEDGFFYSLDRDTGALNWKFWTGSSNASPPLIHEGKIYWLTAGQKLYALSLKGKKLWSFSGPDPYAEFVIDKQTPPVVRGKLLYVGFYQGDLAVLDKDSGQLQWIQKLSSKAPSQKLTFKKLRGRGAKKSAFQLEALPYLGEEPPFPLKPALNASHYLVSLLFSKPKCLIASVFDFYVYCLNPKNGKIRWKWHKEGSVFAASEGSFYQYQNGRLSRLSEKGKPLWNRKIKGGGGPPFTPLVLDSLLVYGFSSYGKLIFALSKTGKVVKEHRFGRGLSSPVVLDPESKKGLRGKKLYFLSIDGYLHKISLALEFEKT